MKKDLIVSNKANKIYENITKHKIIILIILIILLIFTFLIDIMTGPAWLSIHSVVSALFSDTVDSGTRFIVWSIRLPIAVMAIVVGASLSIAGAQMQTILGNPLASPYTLGISAASGFGAALALVLGVGLIPIAEEFIVSINAFVFAIFSSSMILLFVKKRKATTEIILLLGIALLFLFNALIAFLQYIATEQEVQAVVFWLFGSLNRTTWVKVFITAFVFIIGFFMFAKDAWRLTALSMGNTKAESLGVDVEKLRVKVIIVVSLLTATAVCFVGTIGFIGLGGPHIARMLVGEEQRFFLPASALGGALLLSIASICSKIIVPGSIFPIGIITSFIGVPFFVSLILKKSRGYS